MRTAHVHLPMNRLFIGIGSNVGDRHRELLDAIKRVATLPDTTVRSASSIYETEPVGGPPQEWYLNCVIEAESGLHPLDLLKALKGIERAMGRKESVRHGPRVVDLDILLYGDLFVEEKDLTIPHRELHKRAFVLIPLLEIDENLIHPCLHKPLKQLLADLGKTPAVKLYPTPPIFHYNDGLREAII